MPGEVRLEPGDLLAIYSDGVTEAARPGGEMFGAAVLRAVEAFAGVAEPADDISIVVVRRVG